MIVMLVASFPDSLLRFRGALIDALIARGSEVHVAAPDLLAEASLRRRLEEKGVRLHEIPLRRTGLNPIADLACLVALWQLMRRVRPDCVLAYTIKPVVYGTLAGVFAGVPRRFALITGLGYAFQEDTQGGFVRWLARCLYRVALRGADKVFFQNPDDEALFLRSGILAAGARTRVLNGSGVSTTEFQVAPLPGGMRFLLIARLLGAKGVREYAEAARVVRHAHPHASFALAGWIDDNPDAIRREELDRWIAEGSIEYLGRLQDVRPAIAEARVYVLPSYREGIPRTVLEAMAMGRPVITTDAPGCRETVIDGENGFLVPVKSVDALVAAMRRFIENPELAIAMGARSRRLAEARFDVAEVNERMLAEMGIE